MSDIHILSPYDQSPVCSFRYATAEEVQKTIQKLKAGHAWQKNATAHERAEILNKLADLTEARAEEIAQAITKESGKTITDSRIEVARAAVTLRCSAEEARRVNGEVLHSDAYGSRRNKTGIVYLKPIGLVLAITPFNFPINIAAHKIGPSFAAGNVTFFKPHPQNYLSSTIWFECCREAGIPEGVLELCMADIPELDALIRSDDVDCVNFTGGNVAGDAIANAAGFKRLLLELGGNDPLILMPDGDLELAVKTTIGQRFQTAGQRCTAAKRIFVHRDVYETFAKRLVEETKKLKVGDPSDPETTVGPVIDKRAADTIMAVIEDATSKGAELLFGGQREGNIVHPTVLGHVSDDADVVCHETFGPVVPIRAFDRIEEVIERVNSSDYGLQAGIFTNDLALVKQIFDDLEVGTLAVNDGPGFRAEHFPFGGVKKSGIGREGIAYAIREMSVRKTLVF